VDFKSAIDVLDSQFDRPTRIIFARHQLLSCKQNKDESISEFMRRLNILVEKCNCQALSIRQHKDTLLRDALVAGIQSDVIRARLLELNDSEANLTDCLARANAVELSTDFTKLFQPPTSQQETSLAVVQGDSDSSQVAAAINKNFHNNNNKSRTDSNSSSQNQCSFCGQGMHQRSRCPARNATCLKCGKPGHWARVCKSRTAAAIQSSDSHSFICSINAKSSSVFYPVNINNKGTILSLIDPGATESFITLSSAENLNLKVTYSPKTIKLANGSNFEIVGHCDVPININQEKYDIRLLVSKSLVTDCIIGMDILSQHQSLTLLLGGTRPNLLLENQCCSMFPSMNIEPPQVFGDLIHQGIQPIASKTRYVSPINKRFMDEEVERLLKANIIEESRSPWRSQAFVVRNAKPRMVIDYSETVNRFTNLDAYPFPDMENIINLIAQNSVFSKIDLTSAYHQVPLSVEDRPFTAFEVSGRLFQFKRMPFGIKNAVPSFQRIMDNFIKINQLVKTYAYLDDVIVCGETKEEHDINLNKFICAVKKTNITLNESKCKFSLESIDILGYIVENKSKRPNPERLSALLDFPVPTNANSLRRLLGFFAYNAKWVQNYSKMILPILEALKQHAFPISFSCKEAIINIKKTLLIRL